MYKHLVHEIAENLVATGSLDYAQFSKVLLVAARDSKRKFTTERIHRVFDDVTTRAAELRHRGV